MISKVMYQRAPVVKWGQCSLEEQHSRACLYLPMPHSTCPPILCPICCKIRPRTTRLKTKAHIPLPGGPSLVKEAGDQEVYRGWPGLFCLGGHPTSLSLLSVP